MRTARRLGGPLVAAAALLLALAGCTVPPAPGPDRSPSAATIDPAPDRSPTPVTTVPAAFGTLLRSFDVAPIGREVIAAAGPGVLDTAVATDEDDADWRISRLDLATGAVVAREVRLPQLQTLTVGPDGLYLATSVIDKYGAKPDTILRLDPATLRPLARRRLDDGAFWDGGVRLVASGGLLAEVDAGGGIRLLDPRTLVTQASRRIFSRNDLEAGDFVESPVVHDGRLWVLAHHDVLAFSLPGLRPLVSVPQHVFSTILPTSGGLVLVGDRMARLADDGRTTLLPALAGVDGATVGAQAAFAAGGVVAEQPDDLRPRIVLRDLEGGVVAQLRLDHDTGLLLAASGDVLWAQGVGPGAAVTAIRVR